MITSEMIRTPGIRGAGLGALPTDAQLSTVYGYLPVGSGWINRGNGKMTPYLGDAPPVADPNAALAAEITALGALHRKQLILSFISLGVFALSAGVGIWKVVTSRRI